MNNPAADKFNIDAVILFSQPPTYGGLMRVRGYSMNDCTKNMNVNELFTFFSSKW